MIRYEITVQQNLDFLNYFGEEVVGTEFAHYEDEKWYVTDFVLDRIDESEQTAKTIESACQSLYGVSKDQIFTLSNLDQKNKDKLRFQKRAEVKDEILSIMAAENMDRVRNGIWTVSELISLTADPELKDLLDDINTLSFEIAYSKIDPLTNVILTQPIKDGWKALLAAHFYL